ncbi:MAG: ABC transporter substrate-binding protein [Candidatus Babeliales bacterium]
MNLIKYLLATILIILANNTIKCFDNLADLQKYAATYPEQPPSDDEDWLDPDYTSFFQSLRPSFFTRIAQSIGLEKRPSWTPEFFEELLKSVLKQREDQKLSGRLVAHMQLSKSAKFYIWGDLHGAFHSLVRALAWLHKENVITEDLKINNPDHYFIFNGDAIDRSPYILETLSVLLLLLKRNEKQVFYICGKHEDEDYWYNFGLKRELRTRIKSYSDPGIPLDSLVSRFFDTLPLALYISTDQNPTDVIRISHYGRDSLKIDEEYFGDFWNKTNQKGITYYDVRNRKKSKKSVSIPAIIKTEDWISENRTMKGEPKGMVGLGLLDQEYGSMAWAILSAPIKPYQVYFNFYDDVFALVDVKIPIFDSTITLYNQNIKKKDGFKKHESLNLMSGLLSSEKQKKRSLTIGSTMAMIGGGVPISGRLVRRGISAGIRDANLATDNDFHIKLIIYNDDYNAHHARKNIQRLMKEGVDIILCPLGSPTLAAYLDYVKEGKILVLFPFTGSDAFRKKELVNLINWRASYPSEVDAVINYITAADAVNHFAFLYQTDAFGMSALKAAKKILKEKGITKWTEIPCKSNTSEFLEQVKEIKTAQPDAIGFFTTGFPTKAFMRQVGIDFLANKVLFNLVSEIQLHSFLDLKGIKIYWGSSVPNPKTSQLEIVKEYHQAMDRNNYPYDDHSLEGYISANILVGMLKKIEGQITREKIKQQYEGFNNYDYKGFTLTYNPDNRTIFNYLWVGGSNFKKWIKEKAEY